jgi:hypothetical protein
MRNGALKVKVKHLRPRLHDTGNQLRLNQTKNPRGGGVSGFGMKDSAKKFTCGKSWKFEGAIKTRFALAGGNSSFCIFNVNSFCFSDFFPAAIALQIGQGYLPSNVRATDSESECVRRLSASIVVHATVCSSVQCAPSVATRAMITNIFPNRTNTGTN